MKKYLSFILCSVFLVFLVSCGDSDNDNDKTGTQTVTVKITGSANLVIEIVAIATGTGETQTYTDLAVNQWSKDISYEKVIAVSAVGSTSDGASGSMKIQILKGNTVLKESTSEGNILTTTATY
ncbi:MAG: hypothetical protein LBL58_14080 [Tannerellaceae bacterium]|jgi:hypothetical protein|nr:hypothetical protein [Tannerellaceae bacterium]